ncbi:MAG: MBG domain-containing protein [Verrucomicrobiota bacterium]
MAYVKIHHSMPGFFQTLNRELLLALGGWMVLAAACHGQSAYNFGNPSADEQLYIECINRARANPAAEGARLAASTDLDVTRAYSQYAVDLALMQTEFNAIAAAPPLAPNASLTISARGHSAWMLAYATQSHNETNPANTPWDRITAAGYSYMSAGENIFAYATSVWHGHAGFNVDWGSGGTGGMQAGRGHRVNIHSANFHEIGVGVVLGSNGGVGPQLVTQDFGTQSTNPTFGTGVAYYDLNGNNAYDTGEGIAGLSVNVSGASYACTTASGGGWVVPVPNATATRTVTFSGLNLNQSVTLGFVKPANGIAPNAKTDLKLSYTPPVISSLASTTAGTLHTLAFAAVGGATAYQWNRWTLASAAVENCESTANITTSCTGSYAVLNTTVKQQGAAAFHLENSTGASQSLQLSPLYYGQASPSLSFQSYIHYSTSSECFKVQIQEDGGTLWRDVYSQVGGTTESSFSLRSAVLTGMTGKAFRIRFLLSFGGGSYYPYSGTDFGWFMDAIAVSGVATLLNPVSQTLSGTSGSFTPSAGTYLMAVAPMISGGTFPATYQILTVAEATATVTLSHLAATYDGTAKPATATTTPTGLAVNLTYNGSPAPPTNAGYYTVVATVVDINYQGQATATLVISQPVSYAAWAANLEAVNGLAAGTLTTQPNSDFDHDGRSNLIEYAFGSSPTLANDPAPRLPTTHTTTTDFVLQYQIDTTLSDLTVTPQASAALGNWKAPGEAGAPGGFTDGVVATSGTLQTREAKIPRSAGATWFMRVRVSRP